MNSSAASTQQDEIDKFYSWTDPKYVFFYCDTAQHAIAGVDPVKLYMKYHDRCGGVHLKDTHYVDHDRGLSDRHPTLR